VVRVTSALLAVVTAVALTAPARAQTPPRFTIVSRRAIDPASFIPVTPAAPTVVPLELIVEEGSGWEVPGVLEPMLGKASAILSRCRVTLGGAEVLTVRWSADALALLNHEDPYKGPEQMSVLDEPTLPALRPVGFLFGRNSVPSTAKAYNKSSVDAFTARFPDAVRLLGTFWITRDQETRPRRADELPSFSIPAHELVHILGDLPHTPVRPNLMTESELPGSKTGDLDDEQCAAIHRLHP
jgi:hypothetical protein